MASLLLRCYSRATCRSRYSSATRERDRGSKDGQWLLSIEFHYETCGVTFDTDWKFRRLPELEKLLPESTAKNLCTNSVNYNNDNNDELVLVDAITGEKVGSIGNVSLGEPYEQRTVPQVSLERERSPYNVMKALHSL